MILRKNHHVQENYGRSPGELEVAARNEDPLEEDPLTHCFDMCLQQIATRSRDLIYQYYCGEQQEKIRARKELATHLGIPLNALRIRAFRIRTKLEALVRECMARLPGGKK